MVQTYITGVVLVMIISAAWLAVQRLWREQFPDQAQADALADRGGCHGCTCGRADRAAGCNNEPNGEVL